MYNLYTSFSVLPKVLADHMRFTGATGGKAEIKVPFYSYPDLIDVEVTRHDGTEVESNDKYNKAVHSSLVETIFYNTLVSLDGYVAEISIFNLEEDDFGNYSLRLTNRLGFTSELLFVIAEGMLNICIRYLIFQYIMQLCLNFKGMLVAC